jgi:hypothetical protein
MVDHPEWRPVRSVIVGGTGFVGSFLLYTCIDMVSFYPGILILPGANFLVFIKNPAPANFPSFNVFRTH